MVLIGELRATGGEALLEEALAATEESNQAFLARLDGPGESLRVPRSKRSLMVMQGEKAIGNTEWFDLVGSEDATTCIVIAIEGSGKFYVSHVDSGSCKKAARDGIAACTDGGKNEARLYLAGAYTGADIIRLLRDLKANPLAHKLELSLCCCGRVNLASNGFPRTRSLVLDLRTNTPYPFTFENRGPEISRRHAMRSYGSLDDDSLRAVLDDEGNFILPQVNIQLDERAVAFYRFYQSLAQQDREVFLNNFSTSPLHESDLFVPDMIGMMQFILLNDHREVPAVRYQLKDSEWIPM